MRLKTSYYILIPKGEWERFSKSLNIENYIDIQSKNMVPLDKIEVEIDKVEKAAIEKARRRQRIQWRKLSRVGGGKRFALIFHLT
jgi:NADPH-dependent glutamate synthase beta subunit-like oxidoreductase